MLAAVLAPSSVGAIESVPNAVTAVQVLLSKSTQISSLMLAKEHNSLSSIVPKTLSAVKPSADPSTTTTPFPAQMLLVKQVSEMVTVDPSTVAIADPSLMMHEKYCVNIYKVSDRITNTCFNGPEVLLENLQMMLGLQSCYCERWNFLWSSDCLSWRCQLYR